MYQMPETFRKQCARHINRFRSRYEGCGFVDNSVDFIFDISFEDQSEI